MFVAEQFENPPGIFSQKFSIPNFIHFPMSIISIYKVVKFAARNMYKVEQS